jgi:hypothetical protein
VDEHSPELEIVSSELACFGGKAIFQVVKYGNGFLQSSF